MTIYPQTPDLEESECKSQELLLDQVQFPVNKVDVPFAAVGTDDDIIKKIAFIKVLGEEGGKEPSSREILLACC